MKSIPLTLHPLTFDEAVSALLQAKPKQKEISAALKAELKREAVERLPKLNKEKKPNQRQKKENECPVELDMF